MVLIERGHCNFKFGGKIWYFTKIVLHRISKGPPFIRLTVQLDSVPSEAPCCLKPWISTLGVREPLLPDSCDELTCTVHFSLLQKTRDPRVQVMCTQHFR